MKLSFDSQNWTRAQPSQTSEQPVAVGSVEPRVVFEDDWMLVVEKPAGLPVQPDRAGSANLLEVLRQDRNSGDLFLVHRLDRPVFGLVVLAKSAKVQTALTRQMASREFRKTYRCVVEKGPEADYGVLTDLLIKQGNQNVSHVVDRQTAGSQAREARLSFQVLERTQTAGQMLCLLQIELDTGRHHQIRVQLSHAGWPIVGDQKYNSGTGPDKQPIALQAWTITLTHPVNGQILEFQASTPTLWPWNLFDLSHRICARSDKL